MAVRLRPRPVHRGRRGLPATVSVRTFDVFDTLVTRRVGDPESAFLLLGERLRSAGLSNVSAEVFARARIRAKRMAAARAESGEVGLRDVYMTLSTLLELPVDILDSFVAEECRIEREFLVPIPGAVERVDAARRSGAKVAFLSDMYLPRGFILSVLEEHRLLLPGDTLYVSNDVGLSKVRGPLFDHVLADLGVSPGEVMHEGDDRTGDIDRPRTRGIAVQPYVEARLNRYELALEAHRWETGGSSSLLAGASRLARLSVPAPSSHERAVRDVAAGVVSPMLVGYVSWVLRRARALSIDRLYFVARDGEILLAVARKLRDRLGVDVDLRYLYGSRQSWYPAGVDPENPRKAIEDLIDPVDPSLVPLFDRCGVPPSGWLTKHDDIASPRSVAAKLDALRADPAFLRAVTSGLRGRQQRLEQYLVDVGLMDGVRSGVVDLGWQGLALHHLCRMLVERGHPLPVGFYMALNSTDERRQTTESWLGKDSVRAFIVEAFCAGTHGQVLDFEMRDERPMPVLSSSGNASATAWGLPVVRDSLRAFLEHLALAPQDLAVDGDLRTVAVDVFDLFYESPTEQEARAWGSFPYELDRASRSTVPLAMPRTVRGAVVHRLRRRHVRLRWPAGSARLSSRPWLTGQASMRVAQRVLRRLRSRSS